MPTKKPKKPIMFIATIVHIRTYKALVLGKSEKDAIVFMKKIGANEVIDCDNPINDKTEIDIVEVTSGSQLKDKAVKKIANSTVLNYNDNRSFFTDEDGHDPWDMDGVLAIEKLEIPK